ncbi:MAG: hypothetical protein ACR2IE_12145 [Candidatus Sumerlaeaceae bacterium]
MKALNYLVMTAALASFAAAASAQTTMTLLWRQPAGSDYMSSPTTNNCRGMFLNKTLATGGSLLVASRDNSYNGIRRLDPDTGILKTPARVPQSYLTTSTTFIINKVGVNDAGIVYACSLGSSGATESWFRVYRHADEFTTETLAFETRTDSAGLVKRVGDDMDVIGSGNATKIIAAGNGGQYGRRGRARDDKQWADVYTYAVNPLPCATGFR